MGDELKAAKGEIAESTLKALQDMGSEVTGSVKKF